MHPVSLQALATATHGEIVGRSEAETTCSRVEIDSRGVRLGDVFWALRGEHHDGHSFLVEARHRGASAAVVRRDRLAQAQEAWKTGSGHGTVPPLVVVEDTLIALGEFARWHRQQQDGLVIGVTGSFGKTTTREMIHAVLSAAHSGVRSLKNFNNHIGLPLSLLELDQSHEFAVLEMGASAVGEIAMLSEIAQPEVGVITGIGLAHVEGFGSPERIVLAKGELLEALPATGFAILPGDDAVTREMAERSSCPVLFVGNDLGVGTPKIAIDSTLFVPLRDSLPQLQTGLLRTVADLPGHDLPSPPTKGNPDPTFVVFRLDVRPKLVEFEDFWFLGES